MAEMIGSDCHTIEKVRESANQLIKDDIMLLERKKETEGKIVFNVQQIHLF